MYKIVNVTNKQGNIKQDFINEMKSVHPNLTGEIMYPKYNIPGNCFCFVWNDDTDKMLRTSTIEEYDDNGSTIKVVTRNSIYYLEKENN